MEDFIFIDAKSLHAKNSLSKTRGEFAQKAIESVEMRWNTEELVRFLISVLLFVMRMRRLASVDGYDDDDEDRI